MTAFQGKTKDVLLFFGAPITGAGVTGVLYSAITAKYRRVGDTIWTVKTVVTADFKEVESGFYTLRFAAVELGAVGLFIYQVSGAGFVPITSSMDVDPQPTAFLAAPGMCVVTGNVVDLGGAPGLETELTFRAQTLPTSVGGSILSGGVVRTIPDAHGNFSVSLLQGAAVFLDVTKLGLRQTFTVPLQSSATLLSLLPAF